jgi:hypothetical protein
LLPENSARKRRTSGSGRWPPLLVQGSKRVAGIAPLLFGELEPERWNACQDRDVMTLDRADHVARQR